MLLVRKISLVQFKNYPQKIFDFHKRIIGITGKNGVGKTNLLDAIYYLCFTRSYFSSQEQQNVLYDTNGFRIEGLLEKLGQPGKIVCTLKAGKKEISLDDTPYEKFSQHIGCFPAVMIAPDDAEIILGGSEPRRKWLDTMLSQLDNAYLDHLIAYQKILLQRNTLLKQIAESGKNQDALLEILDEQLALHGQPIFDARNAFLPGFNERVQRLYDYLAEAPEHVRIDYSCQLLEMPLIEWLKQQQLKDKMLQRTSAGIHKDDLQFVLNDHPMKTSASQGQRKSFLFALKLAQFEVLKELKNCPPILLLDDIFEKLDEERVSRLVKLVSEDDFGQVFITDTHQERLKNAFGAHADQLQLIVIE
ncbi:DNA replication and repair protein RecF [Chitinophaga caeni]|uniref:DNA replication and repair protein RecF n=1 Tax=Chitinophaga caeni TaxID=2029983 RepID=A0A291QX97_9BACT|nr:DNA replication and repair protein RecF [Chitinophaga caeni]ATL48565.1 DNA replication and repair protein RecF [Chitinophaga caeni]